MGEIQQCAVYLVKQDGGWWRVQLEYEDGDVYLSDLAFKTEEEAMHHADTFIMQYSSNTSSLVH